ncbi:hypothetical protein ACFQ0B_52950 [Nonomuraea thailandensis]
MLTGDPLEPAAGSVTPEPREEVAALAFSPGGGLLAGTTGSEHVQLWDVATRRPPAGRSPDTPAWSPRRPSARTAASWPPRARTTRSGSGTCGAAARWGSR